MRNRRHGDKRGARWQLSLLMGGMVGGALAVFWLGLPARYETAFGAAWMALTLLGMGLWLWKHERALREDERVARDRARMRARQARWYRHGRTIPLSPVQQAFLEHEQEKSS